MGVFLFTYYLQLITTLKPFLLLGFLHRVDAG